MNRATKELKEHMFHTFDKMGDLKLVDNCVRCNKVLSKNSNHHYLCHSCWVAEAKRKGIKKLGKIRKNKGFR